MIEMYSKWFSGGKGAQPSIRTADSALVCFMARGVAVIINFVKTWGLMVIHHGKNSSYLIHIILTS
jgi:hypothetical protein